MGQLSLKLLELEESDDSCTGLIYRADVQHCATKRGILFSVRLNKLKCESCNCFQCMCVEDQLSEIDQEIWPVESICDVESGKKYILSTANHKYDWESGQLEDWNLKLTEIND